jgi:hypothetical protein
MGTLGSRACEGSERVNARTGVDGREPDPSLVVARKLGVGGCEASFSMATFRGRGDFSLATLMAATLLRARSLKGALASHSSREIWGFGCNVGIGGAAGRRCVVDRTADIGRTNKQRAKRYCASIWMSSVLHYRYVLNVRLHVDVYIRSKVTRIARGNTGKGQLRRYICPWRWLIRHQRNRTRSHNSWQRSFEGADGHICSSRFLH